ncbi:MAG TPA: [acyl-carrier-protein] S-malonyltransferase [Phycisphaerales bacterium]|nr:[acyl-carrier-protein] S-malonyltransferase [Phycisphaerales bacterium]
MNTSHAVICPGQGAQAVGMGRAWAESCTSSREIFTRADEVLGDSLGATLSSLCFEGPSERLNKTDASQPAIYTCSVASHAGLVEQAGELDAGACAGLSLGEYTALHLAGVFGFEDGLRLVAERGRLMQEAAEASRGSMVALMGADESQAESLCRAVVEECGAGHVLVPANFNAPGQIVLSGDVTACAAAIDRAGDAGFKAKELVVAGAFHSSLMQPAADAMSDRLSEVDFSPPTMRVWSNVTAEPHDSADPEQIKSRLVQQITEPVRWAQSCAAMIGEGVQQFDELAPGKVLKGLMRRVDRGAKVETHDEPKTVTMD